MKTNIIETLENVHFVTDKRTQQVYYVDYFDDSKKVMDCYHYFPTKEEREKYIIIDGISKSYKDITITEPYTFSFDEIKKIVRREITISDIRTPGKTF